jgi:hypothetical protein
VAGGSSADSMLQFQLKREGDGMKHHRKMKRRQRTHLYSMERKHDMARGSVATSAGGEAAPGRRRRYLG